MTIAVLFILTLLRLFCPYSICTIESNSMEPTLHDGDVVLCTTISTASNKEKSQDNKNAYNSPTLSIDDIVIFKSTNHSDQNWIKRITKVIHQGTPLSLNTMNANDVRSIITGDSAHFVTRAASIACVAHGSPVHEARSHEAALRVRRRAVEKVRGLAGDADDGAGQGVLSVPGEQEDQFGMVRRCG